MIQLNKSPEPCPGRYEHYLGRIQGAYHSHSQKRLVSVGKIPLYVAHKAWQDQSLWNKLHDPRFAGSGYLVLLSLKQCLVHREPFQPPAPPSKTHGAKAERPWGSLTPSNKSAPCDDTKRKADRSVFLLADTREWNQHPRWIREYSLSVPVSPGSGIINLLSNPPRKYRHLIAKTTGAAVPKPSAIPTSAILTTHPLPCCCPVTVLRVFIQLFQTHQQFVL